MRLQIACRRLPIVLLLMVPCLLPGIPSPQLRAEQRASWPSRSHPLVVGSVLEREDVSARTGVVGARRVEFSGLVERAASSPEESILLTRVPVGQGATADFHLQPFEVFTPDARLVALVNGVETLLPRPDVRLYQGRSLGRSEGSMFLSIEGDRVWAVIWHGETMMTYIMPLSREPGPVMEVLFPGDRLPPPAIDQPCQADLLPENLRYLQAFSEAADQLLSAASQDRLEADLMVDVDYGLYSRIFGRDVARASAYVANLYGAVSTIYERDTNVQLRISTLTIWTTPDPFSGPDSLTQLMSYRRYVSQTRSAVSRDLAQLLNDQPRNGGIAYEGTLCNMNYGYSVANIEGNVSFPANGYVWDINVVAHELGHGFGSPHTHCYSPPIDMCYGQEAYCYHGPSIPTRGTIMSYCHLTSAGMTLNFHSRVADVIRTRAEAAPCLEVIGSGPAEIAVDDGTFEAALGLQGGGTLYGVNRLTPARYPATLSEVAIFFLAGTDVKAGDTLTVLVGARTDGSTNLDGTTFRMLSASVQTPHGLNLYDVPDLTITSGDFIVGFRMTHGRRIYPFVLDNTPPSRRRSYISTDGVDFEIVDDRVPGSAGNFGIRARLAR